MKTGTTFIATAGLGTLLAFTTGCASIIHGSSQRVRVESQPSGAKVFVNEEYRGETPLTLSLRRNKKNTAVKVEKEGCESFTKQLQRKFSWWYAGNVVFGGLIGIVVDAVNGAMWYQNCDALSVTLNPLAASTPEPPRQLALPPQTSDTLREVNAPPQSSDTLREVNAPPQSSASGQGGEKHISKQLETLKGLLDKGLISQEEYESLCEKARTSAKQTGMEIENK